MKNNTRFYVDEAAFSLLSKVRGLLAQEQKGVYLVGGFVRDGLRGQANSDIDLVVAREAKGVAKGLSQSLGGSFVLLNEAHQVARVVLPGEGEEWHLDLSTSRGSIEEDLAQRDFTINAMALSLEEVRSEWSQVSLIDPLGGLRDLEKGLVRAVSDFIFRADAARLLRALRFAAELGFTLEERTEALIRKEHRLIATVAGERVRDELSRLLATPRAGPLLGYLDRLGLLTAILPELEATRGTTQPKEHFWDVFTHSLETVTAVERLLRLSGEEDELLQRVPWSPALARHFEEVVSGGRRRKFLLKLAALLHDLGKPQTKAIQEDGRTRFLGHAQEGAALARGILERLRFSNREIALMEKMIEQHLRPGQLSHLEMPSRRALYRYFRDTGEVGIDTLFLHLADHLATRGPALDREEWERHAQRVDYILSRWFEEQEIAAPPKLVDGHIVMETFHLQPGPRIGRLLEAVREAQAAGEVGSREEALALVGKLLKRSKKGSPCAEKTS